LRGAGFGRGRRAEKGLGGGAGNRGPGGGGRKPGGPGAGGAGRSVRSAKWAHPTSGDSYHR